MENVALKQKIEHMLAIMHVACAEGDQCTREEEVCIFVFFVLFF